MDEAAAAAAPAGDAGTDKMIVCNCKEGRAMDLLDVYDGAIDYEWFDAMEGFGLAHQEKPSQFPAGAASADGKEPGSGCE